MLLADMTYQYASLLIDEEDIDCIEKRLLSPYCNEFFVLFCAVVRR